MVVEPASVVTNPPRQWGPSAPPTIYPDPDIIIVDPSFGRLVVGLTSIRRLWTGSRWAEGPAWSGQGRYLVFSDVHTDTQYRYLWDTGEVSDVPQAVLPQQRQHLRFPGPADRHAGLSPARRALGARRVDDGDCRLLRRGSRSIRRTTWWRIRTAASGSPTHLMATGCWRGTRIMPAGRPTRTDCSTRWSVSRMPARSAASGASCRPTPIAGIRAAGWTSW